MFKRQFLPSVEDIENKEIKNLSQRIKKETIKETLTNIVEWQERNLRYWYDRAYMFGLLAIFLIVSVWFLPIPENIKGIVISVFIMIALFDISSVIIPLLPFIAFIIFLFTIIFSIDFNIANKVLPISHLVLLSISFGAMISLFLYLIIKHRSIKSSIPEFKLGDAFKLGLSVDKILKYRLAICRDYAKLTASLLMNIYPKNKLYFITIPRHVATGIEINDRIYVLDQRLPVFTLEKWLIFWKEKLRKKKLKADILKIISSQKNIKTKKIDTKKLDTTEIPKVDIENLTNKLISSLMINKISKKYEETLKIPLKNYAVPYDKDEMVEFSLVRAIKNKLEDEFCGNINEISKIEIVQDKKDLILKIYT